MFRVWVSVGVSVGLRGPFPWASVGNSVGPLLVSVGFRVWTFFWESVQKSKRTCFCVASKVRRLKKRVSSVFCIFFLLPMTYCLLPVCSYCICIVYLCLLPVFGLCCTTPTSAASAVSSVFFWLPAPLACHPCTSMQVCCPCSCMPSFRYLLYEIIT